MTEDSRKIELEVEVPGTVDEVWTAIATGPGVSSWYVPHDIEEREGGSATASFGPGMDVDGRVAVWEPGRRIVFDGGGTDSGLAFEWTIETRDGGRCVVRLVNSGFGTGEEWDDQFDAMSDGWPIFLTNLRLHLEHHRGDAARAMLPMHYLQGSRAQTWNRMCSELGIDATATVGDRIDVEVDGLPRLGGTVADVDEFQMHVLLDTPAPGVAFIASEGRGDTVAASVWSYLYGPGAAEIVERDDALWRKWLSTLGA